KLSGITELAEPACSDQNKELSNFVHAYPCGTITAPWEASDAAIVGQLLRAFPEARFVVICNSQFERDELLNSLAGDGFLTEIRSCRLICGVQEEGDLAALNDLLDA